MPKSKHRRKGKDRGKKRESTKMKGFRLVEKNGEISFVSLKTGGE